MNLYETVRTALLDLSLHRFRSALASLGIVVGVGSVIAVFAISDGQKRKALARFEKLGISNIWVATVKPTALNDPKNAVAVYGVQYSDLNHIRHQVPCVRYAIGLRTVNSPLFSSTGVMLDSKVIGTEPGYLAVTGSRIVKGRFISDMDQKEYQSVCVVGVQAARKLFGFKDPLEQGLVRVGNDWFSVVGVLDNPSSAKMPSGEDVENCVFIPLRTAELRWQSAIAAQRSAEYGSVGSNQTELDAIALQVSRSDAVTPVAERIRRYFTKTHFEQRRLSDYDILVPLDRMLQKRQEQEDYTLLVVSIAAISMVVGGIGIMNIMLANVSDRRKEIGMRRALGARRRDILTQFVIETSTLTSLGGLAGILAGYGVARVFGAWGNTPIVFDIPQIIRAFLSSSLVGIVFGFWPAWQAAQLNPIEALRSE